MRASFLILFVFVMVLATPPAFAQFIPEPQKPMALDYAEIPDEILEEAQDYFESCQGNGLLSLYRDCRCMATRFVEMRITLGPDISQEKITAKIAKGCVNAEDIAGDAFGSCMMHSNRMTFDMTLEEYCECYANNFAKLYENNQVKFSSKVNKAFSRLSTLSCMSLPEEMGNQNFVPQ